VRRFDVYERAKLTVLFGQAMRYYEITRKTFVSGIKEGTSGRDSPRSG
jgi:hypothetical protein